MALRPKHRLALIVIGLPVTAAVVYVGLQMLQEERRETEWRAQMALCPSSYLPMFRDPPLATVSASSWSSSGYGELRWGMGPGDAALRVKPRPGTSLCKNFERTMYAFLPADPIGGREALARLVFESGTLRRVSFTADGPSFADESSVSDYRYSYQWNREWADDVRKGIRAKYGGRWENTTDKAIIGREEQHEMLITPETRVWYYIDDGTWWDGKTRWRLHLIYEDAAYWDVKRKHMAEEEAKQKASGL
jgi:hypothetical protein